jgi:hypothetical protein
MLRVSRRVQGDPRGPGGPPHNQIGGVLARETERLPLVIFSSAEAERRDIVAPLVAGEQKSSSRIDGEAPGARPSTTQLSAKGSN